MNADPVNNDDDAGGSSSLDALYSFNTDMSAMVNNAAIWMPQGASGTWAQRGHARLLELTKVSGLLAWAHSQAS